MFIAFDGIDGAGKSTIYNEIANELRKHCEVEIYDMGEVGFLNDIIEGVKKGKFFCSSEVREYLYYFESNLFSNIIAKQYIGNTQKHVLIDRYILSFLSYGPLNGVPYEDICRVNSQLIWPDYYFYIDIQPENALKRITNYRRISKAEIGYKNSLHKDENVNKKMFIDYQVRVRNNFLKEISLTNNNVFIINNDLDENNAIKKIKLILKSII